MKQVIKISRTGEVSFIMSEHLAGLTKLGTAEVKRASHVEPISLPRRILFHVIRGCVSDKSRIAEWTRNWKCLWQANLAPVKGPILGPFTDRKKAINEEIRWLIKNGIPKP